ncbi:MAG: hypothetical protein HYX51_01420 [Chloroflexi bacterium]|nr:hypothetical protein [Chloroflexota bacterium]
MEARTYEDVALIALQLSPADKVRLIERLAFRLRLEIANLPTGREAPPPTYFGVLAHLGPAPSAEEIDEARREMWGEWMSSGDKE